MFMAIGNLGLCSVRILRRGAGPRGENGPGGRAVGDRMAECGVRRWCFHQHGDRPTPGIGPELPLAHRDPGPVRRVGDDPLAGADAVGGGDRGVLRGTLHRRRRDHRSHGHPAGHPQCFGIRGLGVYDTCAVFAIAVRTRVWRWLKGMLGVRTALPCAAAATAAPGSHHGGCSAKRYGAGHAGRVPLGVLPRLGTGRANSGPGVPPASVGTHGCAPACRDHRRLRSPEGLMLQRQGAVRSEGP